MPLKGHSNSTIYAYSDESGVPGAETSKNDWFLVVVVFFSSKKCVRSAELKIVNLRRNLRLKQDYEFHHINDSQRVQTQFYQLIARLDLSYAVCAIHKTAFKKTASETAMANLLVSSLSQLGCKFKVLK